MCRNYWNDYILGYYLSFKKLEERNKKIKPKIFKPIFNDKPNLERVYVNFKKEEE